MIYRSATLDKATSSDITKILQTHKINSIIDLRGGGESLATEDKELRGQKLYAQKLLLSHSYVGKEGLFGLNMAFLKSGGQDIKRMMDILAKPDSYPVIIHCSAGKDRTGLTIALIQLICNVPKDDIVNQYSDSARLLESEHGNIVQRLGKLGLGPEFSGSDATVMEKTISFIENEYGSASKYLESIGVGVAQQEAIKSIITVQKSKY
ncbi:hypothetical protein HK103_001853 [Boothiomyces macroporosus]|uniref:Tyrosine specific protein phosphatases domain-containing protein n=1 Tax=Boothiomyces macroporosus TaxID=261099 RepID=A0AAD5U9W4_9FUNG|nr:hypothetical protein HK103_001853 [Boothiomyces macroporosus]